MTTQDNPQRAGSPASQIEEVSQSEEKYQKLRQSLLEYELIVDSTEQPIERPVDYQEQKKYYSGKKKMHTLKNQFIVLLNGEDIVDVIVGKLGKTSDINLFRASRYKFDPKQKILGDKAYKGDDAIATPHKKTKKTKLLSYKNKKLTG